ncbi:MAG TPA: molybdopterin-dependent oxidoreductase [Solirubrobacteraceae bacterium]|jgi:NADH-quinone oxidoreductase subunit G
MPRPEPKTITFTIDGLEVQAPENAMLVDAAKHGDVEIPVFCYEPKLGNPVGACRMCLVEIEGIPKLQTGCSTPVKDGMVVHTQTDRVKTAQQAVVEFLLINHPLDCPVCDKGGECPLQDITFGWGPGHSRFIEPKRHFVKPLELSPTITIDRERCILCYRCARFSQEISEDNQLVLLERGAHSYISTFDGHPYVAPFSGNIVELCPVGALTSRPYRFRARPWDIEDAGSVCTLCPSQCNVTLTVRDDHVLRVLAREHDEVDDGWLCDAGRFAYPALGGDERITEPLLRDGGQLRPVSWERALEEAAAGLARAGERTGAIAGGQTSNEEGFLLARLFREGLGSPHLDSRRAGTLPLELHRALADPALQAKVSDLEFAHAVLILDADPLEDMPILDLRLRKGARRHGMRLFQVSPAELLDGARAGELAGESKEAGEEVVILWGERLTAGADGVAHARALLELAQTLSLAGTSGAGLLEIPAGANGRGLREAGVLPNAGPGLAELDGEPGRDARAIAEGLAEGELAALYLFQADPLHELPDRQLVDPVTPIASRNGDSPHANGANGTSATDGPSPDRELWERALDRASTVVAHATFLTEGLREYANVVFPAEAYAEKEGTIVHPDGRLQRLRPAVGRMGQFGSSRAGWQVLVELASHLDLDLDVISGSIASQQLFDAIPFYAGLTLEEIGGRGVRWQERDAAGALPGGTRV